MKALEARVGAIAAARVDSQDYEFREPLRAPARSIRASSLKADRRPPAAGCGVTRRPGTDLAWMGYYVDLKAGQNFRKCGQFGPMARSTPTARSASKSAQPERTAVVGGCGDGCYSMAGFELMTALQNDVPVIPVIFNDNEYKLVKILISWRTTRSLGWSSSRTRTSPRTRGRAALTDNRRLAGRRLRAGVRRGHQLRPDRR